MSSGTSDPSVGTPSSIPPSLLEPAGMQNPFPFYQWALANAPIFEVPGPTPGTGFKIVMSYNLCVDALGRPEDFSNNFAAAMGGARAGDDPELEAIASQGWPQVNTMLTADPPVHTRYRRLVNLAFAKPRVDALEAGIRRKVSELVDGFIDRGECDFVADFAVPLPVQVICEQLGFAASERANVKRWSDAFADQLGRMSGRERELECAREILEFQQAVKLKIDARRQSPTDDLLSHVVNARLDGDTALEDAEILSVAQQLMVAGNETTSHALAGGIVHLARNPEQQAKVRANPKLIGNMVEEVLRLDTPTAAMWRVVTRDCKLGEHELKGGSVVMLRYAAANRDPAIFVQPDRFDVERTNARLHIAFGRGIHMCVGNMLSRREMAVTFETVLARMDDINLVPGAELNVAPNMLLRGYTAVPITFRKVS